MLEIYEFETHLDEVSTCLNIEEVHMDHSSYDIYRETLGVAENYPNRFAADVSISINDFHLIHSKVGPTEELVVKCSTLGIGQENRMSNMQRAQHNIPTLMRKDNQPLLKVRGLCF